jgi:two-component system sensor histidine kinase AtoS
MDESSTILLIEDEPRLRHNLQALLQSAGYRVIAAASGTEAITRIQATPFDLVLTDLVMSDLDGFQVMDYLKVHCPETLVVAITGYVSTESAIEALRKGAYDYLSKPLDIDLLHSVVERALEKARLRKALQHSLKEIKAREDVIQASEARYRSLAEYAPDIIFVLDAQGRYVFINLRVEERLGYKPETLLGRHFTDLFAPESQAQAQALLHQVTRLAHLPPVLALLSQDRTRRVWVEIRMVAPHGASGQAAGLQGVMQDVTKRREIEEQFLRSEKLAAVGQLAAGVAHDLGNVLAIINSTVQGLLSHADEDPPDRESLEVIRRNVAQADRTIRSLLSFATPRAPALAPVDIGSVLEATCLLLKTELAAQHLHIVKRLASDAPLVMADYDQLQQVFLNLLLNAIQAVPEDGLITLSTAFDPEEHQVKIALADTGSGISEADRSRIFEPFFTTKPGGTGLGLCVSDRLIRAHGGSIAVTSDEGKGSVFTVSLPAMTSRG